MSGETRWWWLRHAPVPGRFITGRLDVECDCSDRAAFQALASRLPQGAVLVSSGLRRCGQTLEALRAAGLALTAPEVVPALVEQNFGVWQGRAWDEIGTEAESFWEDPAGTAPPDGESFAGQCRRVAEAVAALNARHAGRDIIAMAHAGTIRAAVALGLDLAPATALRLVVDPLSLTRLDCLGQNWRLVQVNA